MSVNDLSAVLWRERELLELLTFKLEEEQLLLAAGRSRWVSHASREVEQVLERLRSTGLERAASSAAVAEEWGVDPLLPCATSSPPRRTDPGARSSPRT